MYSLQAGKQGEAFSSTTSSQTQACLSCFVDVYREIVKSPSLSLDLRHRVT